MRSATSNHTGRALSYFFEDTVTVTHWIGLTSMLVQFDDKAIRVSKSMHAFHACPGMLE